MANSTLKLRGMPRWHFPLVATVFVTSCAVRDNSGDDSSKVVASSSVAAIASSASSTPVVRLPTPPPSATRIEPELSIPMRRALDGYAPTFRRFAASEYAERQDTSYRADGDFNGDGAPDIALYGRDSTRELLIVLLSQPDSVYRVIALEDRPLMTFQHGVYISLSTQSPGPLDIDPMLTEAETPKRLVHDGINVGYGQEASELYFWKVDHFVKVATGD
jgi:hypothetical protein